MDPELTTCTLKLEVKLIKADYLNLIFFSNIRKNAFPDDEENEDMIKVKPPRPPRKKVKETLKEALYEEDIIEGFSFVGFKTYEDLEVSAMARLIKVVVTRYLNVHSVKSSIS